MRFLLYRSGQLVDGGLDISALRERLALTMRFSADWLSEMSVLAYDESGRFLGRRGVAVEDGQVLLVAA